MGGFSNSVVGGSGILKRKAIQSFNYVLGLTGWTINADGSAEFNALTVRGTFAGLKYEINSAGAFFYGGVPANGNLVASVVGGGGGTDRFGNTYQAEVTSYGGVGQFASLQSGQVIFDNGSVIAEGAPSGSLWLIPTADLVIQPNNIEAAIFTQTSITLAQPVTATTGTAASPTLISTDTWQTMTLINGWTVGTGGFAQYKLMPDNTVMIRLNNVTPGTIADGTSIWTAPSGYIPSSHQKLPLVATYSAAPTYGSMPFLYTNGSALEVFDLRGTVTNIDTTDRYALD